MHAAPSVSYPVGRSPFAAWALAAIGLLGLAAASAYALTSADFNWRHMAVLGAVVACGGLAAGSWRASPQGVLAWDGTGWQWQEGGSVLTGQPEIALDLQARMLLRFRPDGAGVRWLWLERKSDVSH